MRYTRRYHPARSAVARALLCSAMVLGISACDGTLWQRLGVQDARTGLESGETQMGGRRAPLRNPGGQGYDALMQETGGTPIRLANAPRTAPSGNPAMATGSAGSSSYANTAGPSSSPGISPMQSNAALGGAPQAPSAPSAPSPFDMYDDQGQLLASPQMMPYSSPPASPAPAMSPMPQQPSQAMAMQQQYDWHDPRGWLADDEPAMPPSPSPTVSMTPANYATERTPIGMAPVSTAPFEVAQAAPMPPAPVPYDLPPPHAAPGGYPNLGSVPPAPRMRSPEEMRGSYQGLQADYHAAQQSRGAVTGMPVPQFAPPAPPPPMPDPMPLAAPHPAPQQVIEQTRPEPAPAPTSYYAPPPPLPQASMAGEPFAAEMVPVPTTPAPLPPRLLPQDIQPLDTNPWQLTDLPELALAPISSPPPLDTAALRAPMPQPVNMPMQAAPMPQPMAGYGAPAEMYQPAPAAFDGIQPLSAGMLSPPPAQAAPVLAAPAQASGRFLPESRYEGRRTARPMFSN